MTKEVASGVINPAGNYRIFIATAAQPLMTAAQRELTVLDEKLYLQVFAPPRLSVHIALPARGEHHSIIMHDPNADLSSRVPRAT